MRRLSFRVALAAFIFVCAVPLVACTVQGADVPADTGGAGMMGGEAGGDMASGVIAASVNAGISVGARAATSAGVTVERVLAPDDGWIVVRSAAAPGVVLGKAPIPQGESRNIIVPLDALDGPAVRVALHVDRGVRGSFGYDALFPERSMDKPVFADGRPIERVLEVPGFGVEADANSVLLLVSDQAVVGSRLRVRYLLVPGPSWVCVNLVEAGLPGRRIGLLARQAGESQEITIPLARNSHGTVMVTVFADRGVQGVFEYDTVDPLGSADRPFMSAGVAVSQSIDAR